MITNPSASYVKPMPRGSLGSCTSIGDPCPEATSFRGLTYDDTATYALQACMVTNLSAAAHSRSLLLASMVSKLRALTLMLTFLRPTAVIFLGSDIIRTISYYTRLEAVSEICLQDLPVSPSTITQVFTPLHYIINHL